jgi:hypothetical protein
MEENNLHGIFRLDLHEFTELSREVGYQNKLANIKHYDEQGNEFYDEEDIKKYEELREKQLDMFEKLVNFYTPKTQEEVVEQNRQSKQVYCVFRDLNYEGKDLKHIFGKEEDADEFVKGTHELHVKQVFYVI